jgi:hypothetical protein
MAKGLAIHSEGTWSSGRASRGLKVEGVEFKQMGQGGRLGHYPIHFHMARKVRYRTEIRNNSINESMTRWIVLHSTLGVTIAGNVGYKSIGHGFYLEDATETDNRILDNLGIFARAAIDNDQNRRKIAGILSDNGAASAGFPYRSDSEYPSVFWITNGWNEFNGNMAAGAGMERGCSVAEGLEFRRDNAIKIVRAELLHLCNDVIPNDGRRPRMLRRLGRQR